MGRGFTDTVGPKKKPVLIDRKMTPGLFLLRALQARVSVLDLKHLSIGLVNDIATERNNDEYDYARIATQEDIDRL